MTPEQEKHTQQLCSFYRPDFRAYCEQLYQADNANEQYPCPKEIDRIYTPAEVSQICKDLQKRLKPYEGKKSISRLFLPENIDWMEQALNNESVSDDLLAVYKDIDKLYFYRDRKEVKDIISAFCAAADWRAEHLGQQVEEPDEAAGERERKAKAIRIRLELEIALANL